MSGTYRPARDELGRVLLRGVPRRTFNSANRVRYCSSAWFVCQFAERLRDAAKKGLIDSLSRNEGIICMRGPCQAFSGPRLLVSASTRMVVYFAHPQSLQTSLLPPAVGATDSQVNVFWPALELKNTSTGRRH